MNMYEVQGNCKKCNRKVNTTFYGLKLPWFLKTYCPICEKDRTFIDIKLL